MSHRCAFLSIRLLALLGFTLVASAQTSSFGGQWNCPGRGVLTLTQRGAEFSGSYSWNGGGTVAGRIYGNRISANWRQGSGRGAWDMTLSPDGSTISGTWNYTGRSGGGRWSCTRPNPPRPPVGPSGPPVAPGSPAGDVSGSWNCPSRGVLTLTQRGTEVSGSYNWNGGGTVAGRIYGNRLSADWRQGNGRGRWDMTLSPDGSTISGTWNYSGGAGGGNWSCTRAGSPPAPPVPAAPPAPPRGGGGGTGPLSQGITCWDRRTQSWSTDTLSCVSPTGGGGGGVCADPRALAAMDEWLVRLGTPQTKWDCWARWYPLSPDGSAKRVCGMHRPDTDGRTRYEYLRDNVRGTAPGLGTLMEHVNRRLAGR